jgi:predicted DNA-binding protein (UPF0251 family)
MNEQNPGGGGYRKRGRPRIQRETTGDLRGRCYEPCWTECAGWESASLSREELEILRLIDVVGMTQEEAAAIVGVSRRSLWRDLHEARRKVVDALVTGKAIEIEGCTQTDPQVCFERPGGRGRRCSQQPRLPDK